MDVEKAKAVEVRQKAMETFGKMRKRNKENEVEPSSKRRSGSETEVLKRTNRTFKKIKLKKEELALRKAEVDGMQTSMQAMAQTMQNSQQQMVQLLSMQQQQMQQQMQQQQQTQLLSALIDKLNKCCISGCTCFLFDIQEQ